MPRGARVRRVDGAFAAAHGPIGRPALARIANRQGLLTWNIFTSPGWATCNDPSQGNACYTDGLHWTKGDSHVFSGAAFFQLLRGDQNTLPLLDMFLHTTSDPAVMSLDLRNSIEIISDSQNTDRRIVSGFARLGGGGL